jgi:hypothetical protein
LVQGVTKLSLKPSSFCVAFLYAYAHYPIDVRHAAYPAAGFGLVLGYGRDRGFLLTCPS